MSYGVIEYNSDGKIKCEICGRFFERVTSHVHQKHNMNEREYKVTFGFDLKKGICSEKSRHKSRVAVFENREKCINQNLIVKGESSKFKKGATGRTKDKVSEQTRLMLRKRLFEEPMHSKMVESGRKVGLSGDGNKTRWKNKKTK